MTALVPVDPTSETSVVALLSQCASWLSTAVERCSPGDIAVVKAQLATVVEATKQLDLSKEIREDAQEMVRRAEWALGKSIRKGQEDGTVAAKGQNGGHPAHRNVLHGVTSKYTPPLPSPADFVPDYELSSSQGGIYDLVDDVSPEQFEKAITEAKAEGNLSRANVVRKVKQPTAAANKAPTVNKSRAAKADLLKDLAAQGFSSRQMCKALGFSRDDAVRELAREYGIEIPADKAINGTRRVNSTQIVTQTATALEGLVMGVELIDYDALDLAEVGQWAASLTDSLKVLSQFASKIRKATQ